MTAARLSHPVPLAIEQAGAILVLLWPDRPAMRFPAIWLADNRPAVRHGALGQRLMDAIDLPETLAILSAVSRAEGIALRFSGIDETCLYDPAWLADHALEPECRAARRPVPIPWDATLESTVARYDDLVGSPQARRRWLGEVRDRGFARVEGVPLEKDMVARIVALFGYVRETHYGRVFDVVSAEKPHNLAFSSLGLGNHTDNPYRDPVPQVQVLHCLEAAAEGGQSVVVDGFAAAERLRREAPEAFHILATTPVPFRYVEPGVVDLRHEAPLIELDLEGRVRVVRYNNRSIAPLDLPLEKMAAFYDAYRRFGRLLHDPALTFSFRMRPGDLFIVDNRRVLHGRRGFGVGRRHLQGAYADMDSLLSTLRLLEGLPS